MRHIPPLVRRCRRTALRAVFAGLAAVLLLTVTPGAASAANGAVKPLLDCWTLGKDGVYTLVYGYTNTGPATTIPLGSFNSIVPASQQGKQPTTFATGTRHGAFSIRVPKDEVNGGYWYLDYNSDVFYYGISAPSGACPPGTALPGGGNGAGAAVALVSAGALGVVLVRRAVRRAGVRPAHAP